ncbi:MAG: T9SS sorting signal type C domain-containing protein [Flavobacterium sp.]|nr:T9SS sorting signal type C domain-containing protein [Flavobacterium sp.]
MQGASNNVDETIDGLMLSTNNSMLYSLLNNKEYVIQGRSLPFSDEDIVPLGFKSTTVDNYIISIENFDGLFENQNVYLKDNYLNTIHDLKQSDYNFNSNAGTFNDRFEIVYKNSSTLNEENVINNHFTKVFVSKVGIRISSSIEINSVIVYDVLGKVIYQNQALNTNELTINSITANNQALIVKVFDNQGNSNIQKIIY